MCCGINLLASNFRTGLISCSLCALGVIFIQDVCAREWQDNTGTFRVDAELISIDGDNVKLRKLDGSEISVPVERLSNADRNFLAIEVKQRAKDRKDQEIRYPLRSKSELRDQIDPPHSKLLAKMIQRFPNLNERERTRIANQLSMIGKYVHPVHSELKVIYNAEKSPKIKAMLKNVLQQIEKGDEFGTLVPSDIETYRTNSNERLGAEETLQKICDLIDIEFDPAIKVLAAKRSSIEKRISKLKMTLSPDDPVTIGKEDVSDIINAMTLLESLKDFEIRLAQHQALPSEFVFTVFDRRLLTDEERLELIEVKNRRATPRSIADVHISSLLESGQLNSAEYAGEGNEGWSGVTELGTPTNWPTRIQQVFYDVKYVSKGGFVMERRGFVLVFQDENDLWYVSRDTDELLFK